MHKIKFQCLLVCFLSIFVPVTKAQITSATLSGKISDEHGEALPGVTIVLSRPLAGWQQATQSNADGRFQLPDVSPGEGYQIKISAIGFKPVLQNAFYIGIGKIRLDFILSEETTALEAVIIKTDKNPKGGTHIGQGQIKNMPLY